MNITAMLSYCRSHHASLLADLWSIYLKSKGLNIRAFDVLHSLGFLKSSRWTLNSFEIISTRRMLDFRVAATTRALLLNYDNANIPRRVFSMRISHQNTFHSIVVGCGWVFPVHVKLDGPRMNREYQEFREMGSKERFDFESLFKPQSIQPDPSRLAAEERTAAREEFHILSILLDSPEFDDYEHAGDPLLAPPPPVNGLSPEDSPERFIFPAEDLDQSTYEANMKVLTRYFRHLRWDSLDEQKKTSLHHFIPIVGDQLTRSRLANMWKFRYQDINSFERLDWMLPLFGWFHVVMTFAGSLHKQYLGTSSGMGLRRAMDLLNRKGLQTVQTKGPFWHHLDELLHHVFAAHIRACWLHVGKVTELSKLKSLGPQQLLNMAKTIRTQFASSRAINLMRSTPNSKPDEFKLQFVMFNRDVLPYIDLRYEIKRGDVGGMLDAVPVLLQRFAGGGNSQYTSEFLDLIQSIKKE